MKVLSPEEEKEIILNAKKDYKAFDYLYEKYMPVIYNYVMFRVQDRELAEDLVSQVFYKALKNLSLFKWRKLPFSAWLYRIAYHEICNMIKKNKRGLFIQKALKAEDENQMTEDNYEDVKSFSFIHQYLSQLSQTDQELILLRFFEKKGFPEISEILGKNESTLRVNLHRALKRLENIMPEEVIENARQQISL